jgi:cell division protein FtsQ
LNRRRALKIVSLVLLLCALVFVAFEVLHLRKIIVTGCEARSEDEIISLSGLSPGESIFSVDTEEVAEALSSDPYIKPVSVSVSYPDCVKITIQERKEAAYVNKEGTLLIIDGEGWLLKMLTNTDTAPYPEVKGLKVDELSVGKRLNSDTFRLDVYSHVLSQAAASGLELKSMDLTYAADVVLELNNGYTVEIGDDTQLNEKFTLLDSAMAQLGEMGKTAGIIDIASAENAYYREK